MTIRLVQRGNPKYCSPEIEGWPDGPTTVGALKELLALLPDDYTVKVSCIGSHSLIEPYITSFTPCYDNRPVTYELVFRLETKVRDAIREAVDHLLETWDYEH